jgi:hypothetical protein
MCAACSRRWREELRRVEMHSYDVLKEDGRVSFWISGDNAPNAAGG